MLLHTRTRYQKFTSSIGSRHSSWTRKLHVCQEPQLHQKIPALFWRKARKKSLNTLKPLNSVGGKVFKSVTNDKHCLDASRGDVNLLDRFHRCVMFQGNFTSQSPSQKDLTLRTLALFCDDLSSLLSRSNLPASRRKFFTVWPPTQTTQANASWVTSSHCYSNLFANERQDDTGRGDQTRNLETVSLRLACACEETRESVWPPNLSL